MEKKFAIWTTWIMFCFCVGFFGVGYFHSSDETINPCLDCDNRVCPEVIQEFWNFTTLGEMDFAFVCTNDLDEVILYHDFIVQNNYRHYTGLPEYECYGDVVVVKRISDIDLFVWDACVLNISNQLYDAMLVDGVWRTQNCEVWCKSPLFDVKRFAVSEYGWFAVEQDRVYPSVPHDLCYMKLYVYGDIEENERMQVYSGVHEFLERCLGYSGGDYVTEMHDWRPDSYN